MALYLFNLSADAPDQAPDYIPEDLSINDQESFVEIFLERILGFSSAIPEYDEDDHENKKKNANTGFDFAFWQSTYSKSLHNIFTNNTLDYFHYASTLTEGFLQITTPPPKTDLF